MKGLFALVKGLVKGIVGSKKRKRSGSPSEDDPGRSLSSDSNQPNIKPYHRYNDENIAIGAGASAPFPPLALLPDTMERAASTLSSPFDASVDIDEEGGEELVSSRCDFLVCLFRLTHGCRL